MPNATPDALTAPQVSYNYANAACIWIDGERTDLEASAGTEYSEAESVFVLQGEWISQPVMDIFRKINVACLGIDGARADLDIPSGGHSPAYSIIISAGTTYIAGNSTYDQLEAACLWIDGAHSNSGLPSGARRSNGSSVAVR